MYVCVCANIQIRPSESTFVGGVYMVSGLTTLLCTTNKEAHPWERLILPLPEVISCLKFFVRGGTRSLPFPHGYGHGYCHCSGFAYAVISRRYCFTADFLEFWLLQSICLFFHHVPRVTDAEAVTQMCLLGLGFPGLFLSALCPVVVFCDCLRLL